MKVAINPYLIDKGAEGDTGTYSDAFVPMDISIHDLAEYVKLGCAFCPHFKLGKRNAVNFDRSGFLVVDVDNGRKDANGILYLLDGEEMMSMTEAMEHPLYKECGSLLYTTPSHTANIHRFRIAFELEEEIVKGSDMRYAKLALANYFRGDANCADACHIFYGSTTAEMHIPGKRMPKHVVQALIQRGKDLDKPTHSISSDNKPVVGVSSFTIKKDDLIRLADGGIGHLHDLARYTRVHCPHPNHTDRHASAFVLESDAGNKFIYCKASRCNTTYYPEGYQRRLAYDFDHDWRNLMSRDAGTISPTAASIVAARCTSRTDDGYHHSVILGDAEAQGANELPWVSTMDEPFVSAEKIAVLHPRLAYDCVHDSESGLSLREALAQHEETGCHWQANLADKVETTLLHRWLAHEGVTYIKSPKGTGKTALMAHIAMHYRAGTPHHANVLLIGHRRSLINATADSLNLTSYLKFKSETKEATNPPCDHYAICLDSMGKLLVPARDKYDVIIIDEAEQVFAHLLSDTMKDVRTQVLATLRHYIRHAKHIFLLDADLSNVSRSVLATLAKPEHKVPLAVINTFKVKDRVVNLHESVKQNHIVGELVAALDRGERCFLCTNSKQLTEKIHAKVMRAFPGLKSIVITSRNSNAASTQAFIKNIRADALNYDLIAVSPSMGTGIDMTFENDAEVFTVFGIFNARVTTHFDIDQQVSRVRHPKRINVWVSADEFVSETNPDVIRHEIGFMTSHFREIDDFAPNGQPIYVRRSTDDMHEDIYAAVTQVRRASMNRLRKNFVDLRQHNGWTINPVSEDAKMAAAGKQFLKEAGEEFEAQYRENVLNAASLTYQEFRRLRDKEDRSEAEQHAVEKYWIESFYYTDATEELLREDDKGALRDAIRNYQLLHVADESLRPKRHRLDVLLNEDGAKPLLDEDRSLPKKRALEATLSAAKLWVNGELRSGIKVEKATLGPFVKAFMEHKATFENDFDVGMRVDLLKNPTQMLGKVLGLLGLSHEGKRDQSGGDDRTLYTIVDKTLDTLKKRHAQHMDESAKAAWQASRHTPTEEEEAQRTIATLRERGAKDDPSDVDLAS